MFTIFRLLDYVAFERPEKPDQHFIFHASNIMSALSQQEVSLLSKRRILMPRLYRPEHIEAKKGLTDVKRATFVKFHLNN